MLKNQYDTNKQTIIIYSQYRVSDKWKWSFRHEKIELVFHATQIA